jgi:hypothetical protein
VRTLPAILRQRREIARTAVVSNRELFARFQVGAKQCAQVWPVAHDPVGQNAGAAQRAPKL